MQNNISNDEMESLKKDQKQQLANAKSELIQTLNNLKIHPPYPTIEPKNRILDSARIIVSTCDNINDYVTKIIMMAEQVHSHRYIPFLTALNNNFQLINEYKEYILKPLNIDEFSQYATKYLQQVTNAHEEFMDYIALDEKFSRFTFDAINSCITEVAAELTNFKRLRGIADTALTEDIYNKATENFHKQANMYKLLFIGTLLLIAYIATVFEFPADLSLSFWMPKITLSLIGITLVTYFLKQSSHYQKLADQSYQTQVELQALPSFIANISSIESAELIRKELALKYFGKDVDGASHKDMSNLINDQMKSTTELVKATTNIIKKQ